MTAKTSTLPPPLDSRPETRIEWLAERSDERLLLTWACAVALILHGLAFLIHLPEPARVAPPQRPVGPTISIYHPPPPAMPSVPPSHPPQDSTRLTPIPDQDFSEEGPIIEQDFAFPDDAQFEAEIDIFFTEPVQPPGPPLQVGPVPITLDITNPRLIEASKVSPTFPDVPRRAQMPGDVLLQAVIRRDGSVGDITILRCRPPGLGFERSAIDAVKQWLYEPAMQQGNPVEVYFTVSVRFELR